MLSFFSSSFHIPNSELRIHSYLPHFCGTPAPIKKLTFFASSSRMGLPVKWIKTSSKVCFLSNTDKAFPPAPSILSTRRGMAWALFSTEILNRPSEKVTERTEERDFISARSEEHTSELQS